MSLPYSLQKLSVSSGLSSGRHIFVGIPIAVLSLVAVFGTKKQSVCKQQCGDSGEHCASCIHGVILAVQKTRESHESNGQRKSRKQTRAADVVHAAAKTGVVGNAEIRKNKDVN